MKAKATSSPAIYIAFIVVIVSALLFGALGGLRTGTAILAAAMLGFLVYAVLRAPSRYRWFGPGQQQQAIDNWQGQFGKTYPEDLVDADQPLFDNVGRNDLCPCGRGKKYKHCHGA